VTIAIAIALQQGSSQQFFKQIKSREPIETPLSSASEVAF
jgi:hypothetical protein